MTKAGRAGQRLELKARKRIAQAVREYATKEGLSINQLADRWELPVASLDRLVGTSTNPTAEAIPQGSRLQFIAQQTGYSADYLLGLDDRQWREISRSTTELAEDLASFTLRSIRASWPHAEAKGDRWQVDGERMLNAAVGREVFAAGYILTRAEELLQVQRESAELERALAEALQRGGNVPGLLEAASSLAGVAKRIILSRMDKPLTGDIVTLVPSPNMEN